MFSLFARIRQLILPGTAQPNDSAIILGPDLPPCMRARYSAALFFRPTNTVANGINAAPAYFMAQRLIAGVTEFAELGFLIYDGGAVCGYVVIARYAGVNLGAGALSTSIIMGDLFTGGSGVANSGSASPLIQIASTTGRNPTQLEFGQITVSPALTKWTIDGVSAARGLRAEVSSTANTAAIGAEAVILTAPSMTWFDGRAYCVTFEQLSQASVANFGDFFIRRTNLAGAQKTQTRHEFTAAGGATVIGRCYIKNASGGDITDNIVLTMVASAGTITGAGNALFVRSMQVRDCGAAGDYPNAIQI